MNYISIPFFDSVENPLAAEFSIKRNQTVMKRDTRRWSLLRGALLQSCARAHSLSSSQASSIVPKCYERAAMLFLWKFELNYKHITGKKNPNKPWRVYSPSSSLQTC